MKSKWLIREICPVCNHQLYIRKLSKRIWCENCFKFVDEIKTVATVDNCVNRIYKKGEYND